MLSAGNLLELQNLESKSYVEHHRITVCTPSLVNDFCQIACQDGIYLAYFVIVWKQSTCSMTEMQFCVFCFM